MAMWFYQLSQKGWTPNEYRLDIWEGERWRWPVGQIRGDAEPAPGDTMVFFFAPAGGCQSPGFCGWAIVIDWVKKDDRLCFRPIAPSDQLKMCPWWDGENGEVMRIVNEIRGRMPQATLWGVKDDLAKTIAGGIFRWVAGIWEATSVVSPQRT